MASRKDVKQFARRMAAQGVEARATANGHVQYLYQGSVVATGPQTPSDFRSLRNTEAAIQRAIREQQEGVVSIVSPTPATTGSQKLIEERKVTAKANRDRIRQVLISAKEPLTVEEIAQRAMISAGTVKKATADLGLQRRKAQHSERGATLMGANPYLYYVAEEDMPPRRSLVPSVNGKHPTAKVTTAPAKPKAAQVVEAIEKNVVVDEPQALDLTDKPTSIADEHTLAGSLMEVIHTLGGNRVLASCDQGHLYVMDVKRLDV